MQICPKCGSSLLSESSLSRRVCPFCEHSLCGECGDTEEERIEYILNSPDLLECIYENVVRDCAVECYPGRTFEINLFKVDGVVDCTVGEQLLLGRSGKTCVAMDSIHLREVGVVSGKDQDHLSKLFKAGVRLRAVIIERIDRVSGAVALVRPSGVSMGFRDDPFRKSPEWIAPDNIHDLYDRGMYDKYLCYALLSCTTNWRIVYRIVELFYKKHFSDDGTMVYSMADSVPKVQVLWNRLVEALGNVRVEIASAITIQDPEAYNALGEIECMRIEGRMNIDKALSHLSEAARLGWAEALYSLAMMGSANDKKTLLLESANRGYAEAKYRISKAYCRGDCGFESNYREGSLWYLRAAESGYIPAMTERDTFEYRPLIFSSGCSYSRAFSLCKQATLLGAAEMFEHVGFAYECGLGVSVDFQKANLWYDLAIAYNESHDSYAGKGRERMSNYKPYALLHSFRGTLDILGIAKEPLSATETDAFALYDQFRIRDFLVVSQEHLASWRVAVRFIESILADYHVGGSLVSHVDLNHPKKNISDDQHIALQRILDRVEKNLCEAYIRGDVEAQFWAAWLTMHNFKLNFPIRRQVKEAIIFAADNGCREAQEFIGRGALSWHEYQSDAPFVRHYLEMSIENGSVRGLLHLSHFLILKSYGYGKDYPRGFDAYLKAAEFGCPTAMAEAGEELLLGRITGVENNKYIRTAPEVDEGLKWLRMAASFGQGPALYRLGKTYSDGIVVQRDVGYALNCYKAIKELSCWRLVRFNDAIKALGLEDVATYQGSCGYSIDDAIKELKSTLPKEECVTLSASRNDCMTVRVLCPKCGKLLSSEEKIAYGEHVRCESCGFAFLYYLEECEEGGCMSDVALWQQGLIDRVNWPSSEFGNADFWLTDYSCALLGGRISFDEEEAARMLVEAITKGREASVNSEGYSKRIYAVAGVKNPNGSSYSYFEWDPDQYDYLKPTTVKPSSFKISKDFARWIGRTYGYEANGEDSSSVYFFSQDVREKIGESRCYELLDLIKQGFVEGAWKQLVSLMSGEGHFWRKRLVSMTDYWVGPDTDLRVWSARDCDFKLSYPGDMNDQGRYWGRKEFCNSPEPIIIPKAVAYRLMNYVSGTDAKEMLLPHLCESTIEAQHEDVESRVQPVANDSRLVCSSTELADVARHITRFYHLTSIFNLRSILDHGILSKHSVEKLNLQNDDISDQLIQANRRENKMVFDGHTLHDYASFYINPRNAMLYRVCKERGDGAIVIVEMDIQSLETAEPAFSNMNAAVLMDRGQRFVRSAKELASFDWKNIFAASWVSYDRDGNAVRNFDVERKMQAEVLVLGGVLPKYIRRIHCIDLNVAQRCKEIISGVNGRTIEVCVSPEKFFERKRESYRGYVEGPYHVY